MATEQTPPATDDDAAERIRLFIAAAADVALDAEPGADDDHAQDFGLSIDARRAFPDDPEHPTLGLDVHLLDGRAFRATFAVVRIPDWTMPPADAAAASDVLPLAPEPADPASYLPSPPTTGEAAAVCATCRHAAERHVTEGAVADARGAWCEVCDADPEHTGDDGAVHHHYVAGPPITAEQDDDPFTAAELARYDAAGGTVCPRCGGYDIHGGRLDVEGIEAWQNIECDTCRATWQDVYTLRAISPGIEGATAQELPR